MNKMIKPQELISILGNKDVQLIDVRRKDDYSTDNSVIPGATWFDPANIDGWCDTMPKDKEVVLYCMRGGAVSNFVAEALQAKGVNARFIVGGISAWKESGGSVDKK